MARQKRSADARPSASTKPAVRRTSAATKSASRRSIVMQARVDEEFASALVEDAAVLGLAGPSALVREGLRLVHERARAEVMAAAYDEFYGGKTAPLPAGVAPGNT